MQITPRATNTTTQPELIEELLIEELRDLLSAEGQLLKALPKIAKAASAGRLKLAFENHFEETKGQVERLKECFTLLGAQAKAKACKGMAGPGSRRSSGHVARRGRDCGQPVDPGRPGTDVRVENRRDEGAQARPGDRHTSMSN